MIEQGNQPEIKTADIFEEIFALPEFIDEAQAQETVYKLLRNNLGFAWEMLTQTPYVQPKIFPFQEIVINGWFKKDYSLFVAGRGVGKSYLIAIFCILYAIFYPKSSIVIISANFRAAKSIFKYIENFTTAKGGNLICSSFPKAVSRQADRYVLDCSNGSQIIGLPLSGEGLRGQRANVLIIDEGLLVSEEVQKTVLTPFLASNLALEEQAKVRELENQLIEEGHMTPEEKAVFDKNKLIVCSSASYQLQYLYKGIYLPYINHIRQVKEHKESDPNYFVVKCSYHRGLHYGIIKEDAIKAAGADIALKTGDQTVLREYWAKFPDSSGGFFNIEYAISCCHKEGDDPTLQLRGSDGRDYILAIDPSYASQKNSDFFAMAIYMLDYQAKTITLVHSYGRAGADLADHQEYLTYLLQNFNIVWLIIDSTGTDGDFIRSYNESAIAKDKGINLGFVDVDFETDDAEYVQQIQKAKNERNSTSRKIVYKHNFGAATNRKTNEYLQNQLQAKKIWFGSKIAMHKTELKRYMDHFKLPYKFKDELGYEFGLDGEDSKAATIEFIEWQDAWIDKTIDQLALIQLVPTEGGQNFRYDLPTHCKNDRENNKRARKDNYTTLLLANYGAKHLFDMVNYQQGTSETPSFFMIIN